jgi:type IV pilus assembly protein PilC
MQFRYTARNELGEIQAGVAEAASRDLAIKILQDNKLYILSLEVSKKGGILENVFGFFKRVKVKDLMIFTRQFSTLISAEISISDALRTLHKQVSNPALKDAIFDIFTDVDGGLYLSQAISKHEKIFSDFFVNMIRSAEVSGRLEETLNFLSDYLERENRLRNRIRNAMIYPIFVIVVFVVVIAIVLTVVIPQLKSIFIETEVSLPWITKVLLSLGNVATSWGWAFLIIIAVGIGFAVRYFRTKEGRAVWDEVIIGIPVIGDLVRKIAITRFATSVSVLIKGGLPIANSLEISGRVVSNHLYKRLLEGTADTIRKGGSISSSFSSQPKYFPPLVIQMIAIGERSGKLDELLDKISLFYNEEVQGAITGLVELIQPALIVFLGIFIGLFIAAVLVPIYNLAQVF